MSANSGTDSDVGVDSDSEQSSHGAYDSLLVPANDGKDLDFSGSCDSMQFECGEKDSGRKDMAQQRELRQRRMEIMTGDSSKHRYTASAESMKDLPRVNVYHALTGNPIGIALADRPGDLSFPPHWSIAELMAYWGFYSRHATQEERDSTGRWYKMMDKVKPTAIMLDGNQIDYKNDEHGHRQLGHVTERITLLMGKRK